MPEKRDRVRIVYDILVSIRDKNGKIKPTHLLYKSNLSYIRMKSYIEDLLKKGLINENYEGENKFYGLTEKGYKFINEYGKIREFTRSFGL
jgi:predicted transcriptional regulator